MEEFQVIIQHLNVQVKLQKVICRIELESVYRLIGGGLE
jgi:hypothetical protein